MNEPITADEQLVSAASDSAKEEVDATRRHLGPLWPPLSLKAHEPTSRNITDLFEQVDDEVKRYLDPINEEATLEHARRAYENEEQRRKTLDDKATTFTALAGTTLALVSTSAVLLRLRPDLDPFARWLLVATYALTAIHLVGAAYYAFEVRRVTGVVQPSAVEIRGLLQRFPPRRYWIAWFLAAAEFNSDVLRKKSNRLAVSEQLAKRGFVLLAASLLLTLIAIGTSPSALVDPVVAEGEQGQNALSMGDTSVSRPWTESLFEPLPLVRSPRLLCDSTTIGLYENIFDLSDC